MERIDALKALLDKVEAGERPSRHQWNRVFVKRMTLDACEESFNGSLDAAKALHEAVLTGWRVHGIDQDTPGNWYVTLCHVSTGGAKSIDGMWQHEGGKCLARAWIIAILKALISEEDE